MKESHTEGLASHGDPESCAGARKGVGEALTGAHTALGKPRAQWTGPRARSRNQEQEGTIQRALSPHHDGAAPGGVLPDQEECGSGS